MLAPPANGTIFRLVEFPPDIAWRGKADAGDAFDSIGAGHTPVKGSDEPMMHKTSTVDYLIVVKGEIWAILDDSEVCLKQGDMIVQRGTRPFLERAHGRALPARRHPGERSTGIAAR